MDFFQRNLNISGSRRNIDDTSTEHLADLEHLTILDIGYHDKVRPSFQDLLHIISACIFAFSYKEQNVMKTTA